MPGCMHFTNYMKYILYFSSLFYTGSYDTIAAAIKDPLILAKLHFYMAIARTFTPFLKRYQTDEPVMPFLGRDLVEFLKVKIHTGRNAQYHYNAISSFRRVSECLHSFPCSELSVLHFARTSIHLLVCLLTESSETLCQKRGPPRRHDSPADPTGHHRKKELGPSAGC